MNTKKTVKAATVVLSFLVLSACKNDATTTKEFEKTETIAQDAKENTALKGSMLAGVYILNGYGGIDAVVENVGDNDETESYTELFSFPFEKGQEGVKETLSSMWDINSKEDLVIRLDKLLTDETSKYKAWDYARLVNNVNMGYAAEYLTETEGQEWIDKTLPKAKANFKTWEDYHKNFMEGRKAWDSEDGDTATFEDLSKNISNMSVYKNNPLN